MTEFALIVDGVVRTVETHDAKPVMHPSLLWVVCPPNCAPGWTYDGAAFAGPTIDVAAEAAARAKNARAWRAQRLAACDWTQLPDAALTDAQKAAWRIYRQALRDWPGATGFPDIATMPAVPA